MINRQTLLVCDIVLKRYLDVLNEHPEYATPAFKAMIADAAADLSGARNDEFIEITRAVRHVPSETDQASVLSSVVKV